MGAALATQPKRLVVLLAASLPLLEGKIDKSALAVLLGFMPLSAKWGKMLPHAPGFGGNPFFSGGITRGPKGNNSSFVHLFRDSDDAHILRVSVLRNINPGKQTLKVGAPSGILGFLNVNFLVCLP